MNPEGNMITLWIFIYLKARCIEMNEFKNIIIGRIYCAYNEDSDDFIMIRVIDIYENDDKKFVKLAEIDQNNGFRINDDKIIDMEYKEF